MNGLIWFFDPKNIVLDNKIMILCTFDHKLWPKTHFREMMEDIMYL